VKEINPFVDGPFAVMSWRLAVLIQAFDFIRVLFVGFAVLEK
jgi:hypothetical protein